MRLYFSAAQESRAWRSMHHISVLLKLLTYFNTNFEHVFIAACRNIFFRDRNSFQSLGFRETGSGTLFQIKGSKGKVLEQFFNFRVLSKTCSKNPTKSRVLGTGFKNRFRSLIFFVKTMLLVSMPCNKNIGPKKNWRIF
jgi:hypothetical protein